MAAMTRLLAIAVMALTVVIASPVHQASAVPEGEGKDYGIIRDPNCGSICRNIEPPTGQLCYEVQYPDGQCMPVFININVGTLSLNGVKVNSTNIDEAVNASKNKHVTNVVEKGEYDGGNQGRNHNLEKRISFKSSNNIQKLCPRTTTTCLDRGRSAKVKDCKDVLYFWSQHSGHWILDKADFTGRMWLHLMTSGSCTVAVGNPFTEWTEGKAHIGNGDIESILAHGIATCEQPYEYMELQGRTDCRDWPLDYWVTDKAKFTCCGGDKVPN